MSTDACAEVSPASGRADPVGCGGLLRAAGGQLVVPRAAWRRVNSSAVPPVVRPSAISTGRRSVPVRGNGSRVVPAAPPRGRADPPPGPTSTGGTTGATVLVVPGPVVGVVSVGA